MSPRTLQIVEIIQRHPFRDPENIEFLFEIRGSGTICAGFLASSLGVGRRRTPERWRQRKAEEETVLRCDLLGEVSGAAAVVNALESKRECI